MSDPLGLKPREITVMNYAAWSRDVVSNGHFLCSAGLIRSAERLIARGFLTKCKRGELAGLGIVVKVTKKNIETMKAAMTSRSHA